MSKNRVLPSQDEIMAGWEGDIEKPKVSIRCLAYNHGRYVEDTLYGFLIQRTDFPFEILIHDDASTDNTADILRLYQERYPLLIKVVYQQENQYSQGISPLSFLRPLTRGEYVAACEGDDYWTDPNKLAIQVKYLDEHPDIVISVHGAYIIDEHSRLIKKSKLSKKYQKDFSAQDLIKGKALLLTLSWVFRNVELPEPQEKAKVVNQDVFFISLLGHFGGSHFHHDIQPAAYRKHTGGVWSLIGEHGQIENHIITYFWIYRYYKRIGQKEYAHYYYRRFLSSVGARNKAADFIYIFNIKYKLKIAWLRLRKILGR